MDALYFTYGIGTAWYDNAFRKFKCLREEGWFSPFVRHFGIQTGKISSFLVLRSAESALLLDFQNGFSCHALKNPSFLVC